MKQSNFLSLNWRDFLRGLLIAVIAFVMDWLQKTLIPTLDLSPELKLMVITGLAYLSKNLFTPKDKPEAFADDIVGDHPPKDGGR